MDRGSKTLGKLSDEGLEFRVSSLGFRSQGFGFRIQGGTKVEMLGSRDARPRDEARNVIHEQFAGEGSRRVQATRRPAQLQLDPVHGDAP